MLKKIAGKNIFVNAASVITFLLAAFFLCRIIFIFFASGFSNGNDFGHDDIFLPEESGGPNVINMQSALTAPNDSGDILNGAAVFYGGGFFSRIYDGGWRLSDICAARPAFINMCGGYIYYSDGQDGYKMYRVKPGGEPERITEHPASHISSAGGIVYYNNHGAGGNIYALDTEANKSRFFLEAAACSTLAFDGKIFFADGNKMSNIFSADADGDEPTVSRLNESRSENLRESGGMLFYIESESKKIKCMTPEGRQININCPVDAHMFDVFIPWIAVIEAETFLLYAYNIDTGYLRRVGTRRYAFAVTDGSYITAYAYDDIRLMRKFMM
ncbi:MAG: DUF5050 domain-containing protein [Defluviitaleaceae bacterium]|nr:DUF5050 domain-containing protein [Defluviitaleaceae bacterium]